MLASERDRFHPTSRVVDPPVTARVDAGQRLVTVGDRLDLGITGAPIDPIAASLAGGSTVVLDLARAGPAGEPISTAVGAGGRDVEPATRPT